MADVLQASTEYSVIGERLDGTIDLWNEGARITYGYESDEVIGRNASILHVAQDVAAGLPALILAAALRTGEWEGIVERQRKNGERFRARIVVTPRLNPAGSPDGVLLIAKDVSSEIALSEIKATLVYSRSLIEASADALFVIAPDGIIMDVNEEVTHLTGVLRADLVGRRFADQFTDPARAQAGTDRALAENRVLDYELTLVTHAGRQIPLSLNAGVFTDAANLPVGILAAARDITERTQFVAALQEKNIELENANLAKDRFLASMSHELRTPLNAIIGFTGVLLMRLAGPLTEDQEDQLKTVRTSGQHLLSLINDLLDVAKIESGNVELVFEDVVCQDVVHEVAETLAPLAASKGLTFNVVVPNEPVTVRTARRALSQILINFVNNAIKFTEEGSVTIALKPAGEGAEVVQLSVSDTGPGLPPEKAPQLFQAFRQLDSGSTRRHEGTGLGLYLSKKLADLVGCTIALESQVGVGCIFSLGFEAVANHGCGSVVSDPAPPARALV